MAISAEAAPQINPEQQKISSRKNIPGEPEDFSRLIRNFRILAKVINGSVITPEDRQGYEMDYPDLLIDFKIPRRVLKRHRKLLRFIKEQGFVR